MACTRTLHAVTISSEMTSSLRDFRRTDSWRRELGLMPVPLTPELADPRYVLLDGYRGSFCIDLRDAELDDRTREQAWSCNVGHFVSVGDEHLNVQRWDRRAVEKFPVSQVLGAGPDFLEYLSNSSPPTDVSGVSHALTVFRKFRGAAGEKFSGAHALQGYLWFLAAVLEHMPQEKVDAEKWNLSPIAGEVATAVSREDWSILSEELMKGRVLAGLNLDLKLLLRHASGPLFQEAHLAAIFEDHQQMRFSGFGPTPVSLSRKPAGLGAYFTPSTIARSLVEQVLSRWAHKRDALVLDPACGSGEFLRECLRQLALSGFQGSIHLRGFDVSEAACAMARFGLAMEIAQLTSAGIEASVEISCVDALTEQAQWPAADIILMNPPFVAWPNLSKQQKEVLKQKVEDLVRHRPDYSSAFVWLAANSLTDEGVTGMILPASFFESISVSPLRNALLDVVNVDLVGRLGSHELFRPARIDAGICIASRSVVKRDAVALWADYRESSSSLALRTLRRLNSTGWADLPLVREEVSIYNVRIQKGEVWSPRPYQQFRLLEQTHDFPRVEDVFEIRQGVLTGNNHAFILSVDEWQSLPKKEKKYFRPAAMNESVEDGRLLLNAYVFYPYGKCELLSEGDLKTLLPSYFASHLYPHKEELAERKRIDGTRWWVLSEPRLAQVTGSRQIVTSYFGDVGSFAVDMHGEFAVVQGYSWRQRVSVASDDLWMTYVALLNTRTFARFVAAMSNHVGGGQWNLSKRFVKRLPLPKFDRPQDAALVAAMSGYGRIISDTGLHSISDAEREALEEGAAAAFGIVDEDLWG